MKYALIAVAALTLSLNALSATEYTREREDMVRLQIRNRGIDQEAVLKAMEEVPRHELVPAEFRKHAYEDRPLPIGYGQTISQPYIVGFMTEKLALTSDARVLEIGTGSGYQAAVLAQIVEKVFTMEIVPELARKATKQLAELGYDNVAVRHSDGYHGWPEEGPFDAIIVTAASSRIPPPLIEQLKEGGKMIIPVGSSLGLQHLILVQKDADGVRTRTLIPVRFVPFTRRK